MQTALEQLDRMDALVKRMAARGADAMEGAHYVEAVRILADRAPAGFDQALAIIKRDVPLLSDSGQRRLARDVLAVISDK